MWAIFGIPIGASGEGQYLSKCLVGHELGLHSFHLERFTARAYVIQLPYLLVTYWEVFWIFKRRYNWFLFFIVWALTGIQVNTFGE